MRVRLGEVAHRIGVRGDPRAEGIDRFVAGEHLRTDDLRVDYGQVTPEIPGPAFTTIFESGAVLYGTRRTYLRKVGVVDFKGVSANTTLALGVLGNQMMPDYLPWLMSGPSFVEFSVRESKGSVNPFINWSDIARFEFDLPSLDEQHRVVEVMRAVDREIEAAEQVQKASVRALRSYWAEVAGPKRHLGQVAKIWGGGTPDTKNPGFWDGSTPWLAPAELRDRDGEEIHNTERTITEAGLRAIGGRLAPSGAVLITSRATVGTVVTAGRPIAVNQGIAVLEPGPDIDGRYLKNWCRFNTHEFLRLAGGSTFLEVSKTSIASIALPVPSAEDQETIAALSSRLEDCARDGQASARASYALRASLLQELIG
jgi:type I restriction enzyme S subunit